MGDRVKMSDGRDVPVLAFGTSMISDEQMREALGQALDVGYRHIDTAQFYRNEKGIGDVLREYFSQGKLKRDDVFVTTKVSPMKMRKDDVRPAVEESLRKLQLDYVDLMLLHSPCAYKNGGDGTSGPMDYRGNVEMDNVDFTETWKELEKLVREGKIHSLGISNFNSVQTDTLLSVATVRPVLNQVECHAYLPQQELQEFSEKRKVLLEAYAPLSSPGKREELKKGAKDELVLLEEPVLKQIGDKYGKTPAQVLIRNLLQRGMVVTAKSSTPSRIKENFEVFDFTLSAEDMAAIGNLRNDHRYFTFLSLFGAHPQYPFNIPF
ncbi:aldo-keto reductase family 1 member A1-like isoform X2 [Babylonia areolata]|uniref:aldo-keto reductase family 1 member A1-like isoform X2 n=1 Tax=Babylonia areolata TaxID=304850 RepID=UPI003FD1E50F